MKYINLIQKPLKVWNFLEHHIRNFRKNKTLKSHLKIIFDNSARETHY